MGERGKQHLMGEGEMHSFVEARLLSSCGLGREGHQTLSTWERDFNGMMNIKEFRD